MKPKSKRGIKYIIATINDCLPFMKNLILSGFENLELANISSIQRKNEYMAVRLILQKIVINLGHNYNGLFKDHSGKPFLNNLESLNISLSHSGNYVMAAVSLKKIGIDIQIIRKNVSKLATKFLSKTEIDSKNITNRKLITIWALKESIFKIDNSCNNFSNINIRKDFDLKNEGKITFILNNKIFYSFLFHKKDFCFTISFMQKEI